MCMKERPLNMMLGVGIVRLRRHDSAASTMHDVFCLVLAHQHNDLKVLVLFVLGATTRLLVQCMICFV
jgi:hypothetical protein